MDSIPCAVNEVLRRASVMMFTVRKSVAVARNDSAGSALNCPMTPGKVERDDAPKVVCPAA